jgi:hypothetical protein
MGAYETWLYGGYQAWIIINLAVGMVLFHELEIAAEPSCSEAELNELGDKIATIRRKQRRVGERVIAVTERPSVVGGVLSVRLPFGRGTCDWGCTISYPRLVLA